jgi:hypothetical protein
MCRQAHITQTNRIADAVECLIDTAGGHRLTFVPLFCLCFLFVYALKRLARFRHGGDVTGLIQSFTDDAGYAVAAGMPIRRRVITAQVGRHTMCGSRRRLVR